MVVDIKNLYELENVLEVYDSLEEKKWIEKLLDNVKEKIYNNELNENNIDEFKDSVRKITTAYWLMKDKFSKKFRDGWDRYFEHLRAVTNIVLDMKNPSVQKVLIALYHDSIEDVDASYEVIFYVSWSEKIALAVQAMSKRPWQDYSDDKIEWKAMRNEEYFEHLSSYENMQEYIEELCWENDIELSAEEIDVVIDNIFNVKFADRIHNLSTQWDENNTEKVKRKVEETKKYFLEIAYKTNPEAYKKLKTLILELEVRLANFNWKSMQILAK